MSWCSPRETSIQSVCPGATWSSIEKVVLTFNTQESNKIYLYKKKKLNFLAPLSEQHLAILQAPLSAPVQAPLEVPSRRIQAPLPLPVAGAIEGAVFRRHCRRHWRCHFQAPSHCCRHHCRCHWRPPRAMFAFDEPQQPGHVCTVTLFTAELELG